MITHCKKCETMHPESSCKRSSITITYTPQNAPNPATLPLTVTTDYDTYMDAYRYSTYGTVLARRESIENHQPDLFKEWKESLLSELSKLSKDIEPCFNCGSAIGEYEVYKLIREFEP